MSGETDLGRLLAGVAPVRRQGQYVFVTVSGSAPEGVPAAATIAEPEGLTLVVEREVADELGLAYEYVAGWITLRVHSALDAVGLTAAVATTLSRAGISCNVLAGYYHDHLLVPVDRAREAVRLIAGLAG